MRRPQQKALGTCQNSLKSRLLAVIVSFFLITGFIFAASFIFVKQWLFIRFVLWLAFRLRGGLFIFFVLLFFTAFFIHFMLLFFLIVLCTASWDFWQRKSVC